MGQNLVLNLADHGISVVAYDPWPEVRDRFFGSVAGRLAQKDSGLAAAEDLAAGRKAEIRRADSITELVSSLHCPRRIMLMVKAGKPVDDLLEQLTPVLESGDIIIDGGNSHFRDTRRRAEMLEANGLHYLGIGVSGGEEGARNGPSLMAGGHPDAWRAVAPILTKIAARAERAESAEGLGSGSGAGLVLGAGSGSSTGTGMGRPCCGLFGADGAGHFIKMVHNGIEYADMELIAEAYLVMRDRLGMEPNALSQVFHEWNRGELNSYLIETTAEILSKQDRDTGRPMVDVILDQAGQKGTGMWTVQEALELGMAVPTIAAAVFARNISADRAVRTGAAARFGAGMGAGVGTGISAGAGAGAEIGVRTGAGSGDVAGTKAGAGDVAIEVDAIRKALFASKICAYAQGLAIIRKAAAEYHWDTSLSEVAMVWQGGCIIRARFLNMIKKAFDRCPDLDNLVLDPYFADAIDQAQPSWRKVVAGAELLGIPVPAFSSALAYFDSYRRERGRGPASLLQAQRDYFGAHTYRRMDQPGVFHTDWHVNGKTVQSTRVDEK